MKKSDYFDRVANKWDEMRKQFFPESLREKAIEKAHFRKNSLTVDIGAGSGFITEGLLKRGFKVIAVDRSKAMLEEMRRKFKDYKNLDLRIGDAQKIPVEDGIADCVFANMCLHHVENPGIAIKEMARILKNGGKLVITDLDEHDFEFLRTEQSDYWLGFKREDIRKWFEEAGLKEVKVECANENCCASSSSEQKLAKVSIFIASGTK